MARSNVVFSIFFILFFNILVAVSVASSNNKHEHPYSFYDDIRISPTASISPLVSKDPSHLGRNLHLVTDRDLLGSGDYKVLCHLPTFFRWTQQDSTTGEYSDVSDWAYGGSAAALLAIHHFNEGDGSIVSDLQDINQRCPIRLTAEMVDSQSSPIVAVAELTRHITRNPFAKKYPQACAIIGSSWSSVTKKMATVSGVHDLLQVTPSASSVDLDDKGEYPLFARTHPSDAAMAELGVSYFAESMGVKYFALLYVDNGFGTSYKKEVINVAARYDMIVESATFRPTAEEEEIRFALAQLQRTTFNYFMLVVFPAQYELVMEIAGEMGLAGPGRFWLYSGTLASSLVDGSTKLKEGSYAANATYGNAIIHDEGGLPGFPQFDLFMEKWEDLGNDAEALNYINSKQPPVPLGANITFNRTSEYFQIKPSHIATFSYDAVVGIGLSACLALNESLTNNGMPNGMFSGAKHHEHFVEHSFRGATGDVIVGPDSFSRTSESTYFVISNILKSESSAKEESDGNVDEEYVSFQGSPRVYFDTISRSWKVYETSDGAKEFVYPDGTTMKPKELPQQVENKNYIQPAYRAACFTMGSIGMVLSLGFLIFTFVRREHPVIRAAQPPFLMMLCFGTLVMSSMIIPRSIDDAIATQEGCSLACKAYVWLFSIGFVITFSTLFSKLWRINKLFKNASGFKRVKVGVKDVILPFLALLVCNVIILTVWEIKSPLNWKREVIFNDNYDRPLQSIGKCVSEEWVPYLACLMIVNGFAMVLAMWQAYSARNVTTEFAESKYIALAMLFIFQALFMGAPVILLVSDNTTASLFIICGVVLVICLAILFLIFVPKINIMRNGLPTNYNARSSTWMTNSQAARIRPNYTSRAPESAYSSHATSVAH